MATHFRATSLSVFCPKGSTPVIKPARARFGRLGSLTGPFCHLANRHFAWQIAKWLGNKHLTGQFATLPTPLSDLLNPSGN
jgi:hypothetical protein